MKKLISWTLRIIPIITIYQGIVSGGARLKPFTDTVKVALTQYEVVNISNLLAKDLERTNGIPIETKKFSAFIRNTYHNQFSILSREIMGDKTHDHAVDIWGQEFQLLLSQKDIHLNIKIASAGPDGERSNKDDIAVDFSIENLIPAQKEIKIIPDVIELANEEASETENGTEEVVINTEDRPYDYRDPAAQDEDEIQSNEEEVKDEEISTDVPESGDTGVSEPSHPMEEEPQY